MLPKSGDYFIPELQRPGSPSAPGGTANQAPAGDTLESHDF